jgi:hypothetical protein
MPADEATTGPDDSSRVDTARLELTRALSRLIEPLDTILAMHDANMRRMNKLIALMTASVVLCVLLLLGLSYALFEQRGLRIMMHTNAAASRANNLRLAEIADTQTTSQKQVDKLGDKLDEQPKITLRPADSSEPGSRATIVVEQPPRNATKRAPKPAEAFEIPLDLPNAKPKR